MSLANATQAHRESLQRQTQEAFAIVILSFLIPLKIVDDLTFCLKVLKSLMLKAVLSIVVGASSNWSMAEVAMAASPLAAVIAVAVAPLP